jgi:LPXTG-motif cell wall-anchored protein
LKGVEGGVQLGLGRATAAVTARQVRPEAPKPAAQQLPRTGGTNLVWLAFGLIVAAGAVLAVRRRFSS